MWAKAASKFLAEPTGRDRCLCLPKERSRPYWQRKRPPLCCWAGSHWGKGLFGGILSRPEKKESKRRRQIGRRGGSNCRQWTMRSLFPCLKTDPDPQEALRRRHFLEH